MQGVQGAEDPVDAERAAGEAAAAVAAAGCSSHLAERDTAHDEDAHQLMVGHARLHMVTASAAYGHMVTAGGWPHAR